MMKKTKLIFLFMLVLPVAFVVSNTPAAIANYSINNFTAGNVNANVSGGTTMTDACVWSGTECVPMVQLKNFWICEGDPSSLPPDSTNCWKADNSTLCVGDGSFLASGGNNFFNCNTTALVTCSECWLPCGDGI